MTGRFLLLWGAGGALSFFLTGWLSRLARKLNLLDEPSGKKIHQRPVPRVGGVAIVAVFLVSVLAFRLWVWGGPMGWRTVFSMGVPLLILIGLGLYDDFRGANAAQKFFFQIACALFVYYFSVRIRFISIPFVGSFPLGGLSLPITALWIVLSINAFNLIDGLDGLLVRIALYASLSLAVVFFVMRETQAGFVLLLLTGSLLGFLPWNLYPAKIFMGDTGSMFLGFVFAWVSMAYCQKGAMTMNMSVPLVVLFVPLFDTVWSFFRRIKGGTSPFKSDHRHFHHRLLKRFGSHKKASFVLSSISGGFSVLGGVAAFVSVQYRTIIVLLVLMVCLTLVFFSREKRVG